MKNIRKIFLPTFILLAVFPFAISGQTNVSGGIYSNTTWTLANSPYIVTDTIVVFPGVSLTIQPGVVVKFNNDMRLEIRQAKLIAIGTSNDSITFTSNSSTPISGIWDAVYLNGVNATIKSYYCNFLYAKLGIYSFATNYEDTILVKHSNFNFNITGIDNEFGGIALIDSCNFKNNIEYGLFIEGGILNYCNISNNKNGIYGHTNIIKNTLVNFSSETGIESGIGASTGSTIENCHVFNNKIGIISWGGDTRGAITNCLIDSNLIAGVTLYGYSPGGDCLLNCHITYNGIGILDTTCSGCTGFPNVIMHNVIENNNIGISENTGIDTVSCNKICNNITYNLYYASSNNFNISNNYWCTTDSSIVSAKIYDGYDNINLGLVNFMPIDTAQCYLTPNCIPPTAAFNYTSSNFTFNFADSSISSPTSWLWSFGDSSISTLQNPVHVYTSAGIYSTCLIAGNSCGADTICHSVTTFIIGISKNNIVSKISIFPNPAFDNLSVTVQTSASKTEIKIFNLLGELEYSSSETKQKIDLDVSGLTSGLHIIQIATGDNISRQKFIKK